MKDALPWSPFFVTSMEQNLHTWLLFERITWRDQEYLLWCSMAVDSSVPVLVWFNLSCYRNILTSYCSTSELHESFLKTRSHFIVQGTSNSSLMGLWHILQLLEYGASSRIYLKYSEITTSRKRNLLEPAITDTDWVVHPHNEELSICADKARASKTDFNGFFAMILARKNLHILYNNTFSLLCQKKRDG